MSADVLLLEGRIIMCVTDLMFRKRFGTYVGRTDYIKYRGDDSTKFTSRGGSHPRHQASTALICPADGTYKTVDMKLIQSRYNRSSVRLLVTTACQLGVALNGTLELCKGYSMSKAQHRPLARQTASRATKRLGRVFVDIGGLKIHPGIGGTR